MFRINIRTAPTKMPSLMARNRTTETANRAALGRPAPSSFEIRVLTAQPRPKGTIHVVSEVLRLTDRTDVSNAGLGRRPAKRTINSNDHVSKFPASAAIW
uniref:Uncharacterized protein n=1 Tax=Opuntia streptacantha TaxID=393608 RepID=A0A7C9EJA7_OPUST